MNESKGKRVDRETVDRQTADQFDQRILDWYDDYAHGRIERRDFLNRVATVVAGGVAAETVLARLAPNYAWAQQVPANDPRIKTQRFEYDSQQGGGKMAGLMAWPADNKEKHPAVVVVHENRGLNPYIEDVARRLAVAGFLALAPDALSPLGGYPGTDDEGRQMQAKRDPDQMREDFLAAAKVLRDHPASTGKVGVVGFCYGGGIANELAVRASDVIAAAVPFYGRQAAVADAAKIRVPLLLHYAELDQRINEGWPAYEKALKEAKVDYTAHFYPKANHGFHNDTTPRYDKASAELAWKRTLEFFHKHLDG